MYTKEVLRSKLRGHVARGTLSKSVEAAYRKHEERQARKLVDEQDAKRVPNILQWLRADSQRRWDVKPPACACEIELNRHDIRPTSHPRAKNWLRSRASFEASNVEVIDEGRYSSRVRYTKYSYRQHIECWGAVLCGRLWCRIDTNDGLRKLILSAPRGWRWSRDQNGIVLLGPGNIDYHPDAYDLLARNPLKVCQRQARQNAKKRRQEQRQARREAAIIRRHERSVRVCVRDSLRAGNCYGGTVGWCERHGFDPSRHYSPAELLAQANGDTSRVAIVVLQAIRRQEREVRQGFCELADHRA
jgi:hypothetical protein